MIIGIPKEIKEKEFRVGIVPDGIARLTRSGHQVLIDALRIAEKEYCRPRKFLINIERGACMQKKPVAAGKSSFDLINREQTFHLLGIPSDAVVVDLACGLGNYTFEVAGKLGNEGIVYAIDLWEEGIDTLKQKSIQQEVTNITALVADITKAIPLDDDSVDFCLMATVLHDLTGPEQQKTLHETSRMMRPGGILAIIEFKKLEEGPGPPIHIRIDGNQVENIVTPHGFTKSIEKDNGPFTYLITFVFN